MIKPTFHHVNLKTTRLQQMIDWYGVVVGATVNLQSNNIAFISNDRTHHRIAFLAVPGLRDDPEKFVHTGIHHTAFEYDSFDDLMSSFARLRQLGIEPEKGHVRGNISPFEAAKPTSASGRLISLPPGWQTAGQGYDTPTGQTT
jgi:catechol-2,3-dioxygenase